jgi:hypothetical protein
VRPKTIVYFERITFGMLLLPFLLVPHRKSRPAAHETYTAVPGNLTHYVYLFILIRIITFVVYGTLTLLISRGRSKIAMWVSIALFALSFAGFVTRLLLPGTALQLGNAIRSLAFLIVRGVAYGLLFTPSARSWMRREDKNNEKLREVFE